VASPGSCFEDVIWMPVVLGIFLSSSLKKEVVEKEGFSACSIKPSINKEE
jgi:hypothetical protein